MRTIRKESIDGPLVFRTPPQYQGQGQEVSFAGTYDGCVIRRTVDRSDGTVVYSIATLTPDEIDKFSPPGSNGEPETDGDWEPIDLI